MKKHFSLEKFLYLVIFLLPVYLVKASVFGLPTNALEILIAAAFVWALFIKIDFGSFLKASLGMAIAVIFLGLILSTLINQNYAASFGIIKGWFIFPFLLAILVKAIIPREGRKHIFLALYASALTVAAISLGYYVSGVVTFDGRLQGVFNSPNYLAMYLAAGLIIGVHFIKESFLRGNALKASSVLSFLTILVSLYLTYSYAAWTAVITSVLISEYITNRKKIHLKKVAVISAGIILIILSQWNSQKFKDFRMMDERSSFKSREMIWRSAGKILSDNPVFGIGPGNFQGKYLEYQKHFSPYLEWAVPHPHNLYLAWWLYGGALSFVGFAALIVFWFQKIAGKEKNSLWAISFAIMLYFLIHGLADTTYFKNDLAAIFWINFFMLL